MKKVLYFLFAAVIFSGIASAQDNNPKFSGLMFGDYFYNIDSHDTTKKDLNGFQFRRIYITTDYAISEKFDTRFRLEADQGSGSLTAGGKIGVMVKDAWFKWKNIFQGSDFVFGLSPTPAFDVSEAAWGYRSLEKTIMDFNGVVSSRDLGIDLKGKFNEQGTMKYWVKIGNNSGNSPEVNKYKRYYGLLQFIPIKNFQFTVYGDYASNPQIRDLNNELKDHGTFTGAVMLNVKEKDKYSVGVESFYRSQANNYYNASSNTLESQTGYGVSVFAWVGLTDMIRIVGRFDTVDPNTDVDKDGRNLIIGALDFRVDKNVSIMPNVEALTYQSDLANDVTGRVTLFYQF